MKKLTKKEEQDFLLEMEGTDPNYLDDSTIARWLGLASDSTVERCLGLASDSTVERWLGLASDSTIARWLGLASDSTIARWLGLASDSTVERCLGLASDGTVERWLGLASDSTIARWLGLASDSTVARCLGLASDGTVARCLGLASDGTVARCLGLASDGTVERIQKISKVQPLENPYTKILEAIKGGGGFEMRSWHSCETTHCLGGWMIQLHPQGKELEAKWGTRLAATMLFLKSSKAPLPNFAASNEAARFIIEKRAKEEASPNDLRKNK